MSNPNPLMFIDDHVIRPERIDAITRAQITLEGVREGTDQIACGEFDILIGGERITIYRNRRSEHNKAKTDAAVRAVRSEIETLRKFVQDAMRSEP